MQEDPRFFGTATVGEKGQIVIPAEARQTLNLDKGSKLLVMSGPRGALVLVQPAQIQEMAKRMNERLSKMNDLLGEEAAKTQSDS